MPEPLASAVASAVAPQVTVPRTGWLPRPRHPLVRNCHAVGVTDAPDASTSALVISARYTVHGRRSPAGWNATTCSPASGLYGTMRGNPVFAGTSAPVVATRSRNAAAGSSDGTAVPPARALNGRAEESAAAMRVSPPRLPGFDPGAK